MPLEFVARNGLIAQSNSIITGSLTVTNGITGSISGIATSASFAISASQAASAVSSSYALNATSASFAALASTASYFLTSSVSSASFATSASFAATSSFASNFTVANTLTATTLVVNTISSSVVFSSGSNVFGNSLSNTQVFTGSVNITGSFRSIGPMTVSGSAVVTGSLTALSLIKVGGTSTQYLMADGSTSLFPDLSSSIRSEQTYTATANQTTFTVTGGYVVGLVDVYVNGVKYAPADYTATNGTTVVLTEGVMAGDIVSIINYKATIAALPTSRDTFDYTATAGQTSFTVSGGYTVGLLDVYVNGVKLTSSEYTATNGTTFVLTDPSVVGDQVQAIRYNASVNGVSGAGTTNYIPKFTASQTLGDSAISDNGTTVTLNSRALSGSSAAFSSTVTTNGQLTMAYGGNPRLVVQDTDSGAGNVGILFKESTNDRWAIASVGGALQFFNETTSANAMYITSGSNVGIGTTTPTRKLSIDGGAATATWTGYQQNGTERLVVGLDASGNPSFYGTQANDAIFYTNNTERMRINSSGYIGIGTTSPTYSLDISGTTTTALRLTDSGDVGFQMRSSGSNNAFSIRTNGSTVVMSTSNSYPLSIGVNSSSGGILGSTTGLTIASGGAATFASTVTATGAVRSINTGVDATFADAFVGVYASNNNEQNAIQTSVSSVAESSGFRFQASNGGGSSSRTNVVDFRRDRALFYTNVGIGTTAPVEKLDVTKSGNQTDVNWGSIMIRNIANYAIGNDASIGFALNNAGNTNCDPRASIGCKTESDLGGALVFNTRLNAGTYNEKMRITGAGFVGIGTTSPGYMLDITGNDNTATSTYLRVYSNNRTVWTGIGYQRVETNGDLSIVAGGEMVLRTGGSISATITSAGNLGMSAASDITFGGSGKGIYLSRAGLGPRASLTTRTNTTWVDIANSSDWSGVTLAASGGVVYINTTSNPLINATPQLGIVAAATTDAVSIKHNQNGNNIVNIWQTGASAAAAIVFYKGDSQGGGVGNINITTSGTTYNSTSDYRLKENIIPLQNGIDRLMQLKPSKFNWIETGDESEGFIAHELQEIFPDAVTGEKDAVYNSTGNIKPQSVDYGRITPLLVKALQEQQVQIQTLTARLQELENK